MQVSSDPLVEEILAKDYKFCIDEYGIHKSTVKELKKENYDNVDEEIECFIHCFFKRVGFMDDKANLFEDTIMKKVTPKMSQELANRLYAKCKDVKGGEPCNTAFLFYKCFKE